MNAPPSRPAHWIQSPLWDGFWIFAGLWAPALALLGYALAEPRSAAAGESYGAAIMGAAVIYLPLSVLHRISTIYTVLATPLLRDDLRNRPGHYLYLPLGILLGSIALSTAFVFHHRFAFLPGAHGELWAFFVLAYVMILWERWHFCAQEFGVLSIYRIRAQQFAPGDRRFDRVYTMVLMLGVNMVLYAALGFSDECGVLLWPTSLAGCTDAWLEPASNVAFGIGAALIAVALFREWRHPHRSLPKLGFYALIASHTVLLYAFPRGLGLYFLGYMFHHWMVSIALFGRVTARTPSADPSAGAVRKLLPPLGLAGLFVLFYLFFEPLDKAGRLAPVPDANWFAGASGQAKIVTGVVIGVFFALNFLHYYYDRCLYSFHNPEVRKNVGPVLFGPAPSRGPRPGFSAPALPGDIGT